MRHREATSDEVAGAILVQLEVRVGRRGEIQETPAPAVRGTRPYCVTRRASISLEGIPSAFLQILGAIHQPVVGLVYGRDARVMLRGRGEAARGPGNRGVSLCRVVVAMWPVYRDGVPCRRRVRICVSEHIDPLSWLFAMMCGVLEFVGKGHSGVGRMACIGS